MQRSVESICENVISFKDSFIKHAFPIEVNVKLKVR
jgi:hypothetical protein